MTLTANLRSHKKISLTKKMKTKVLPTLCVLLLVLSGPIPDIVIGTQENNHPYFLGKFADKQVLVGCDMDLHIYL